MADGGGRRGEDVACDDTPAQEAEFRRRINAVLDARIARVAGRTPLRPSAARRAMKNSQERGRALNVLWTHSSHTFVTLAPTPT